MSSREEDEKRRRLRYRLDPEFRVKALQSQARYEGRDTGYLVVQVRKGSYSRREVCDLAGISEKTFRRYQAAGLIPPTTYPSGWHHFWPHQVLLIMRLFKRMRQEGWPNVPPHYVGSKSWAVFLAKIKDQWVKEKHNVEGIGIGQSDHDKVGEN